jgi:hypothetical protein
VKIPTITRIPFESQFITISGLGLAGNFIGYTLDVYRNGALVAQYPIAAGAKDAKFIVDGDMTTVPGVYECRVMYNHKLIAVVHVEVACSVHDLTVTATRAEPMCSPDGACTQTAAPPTEGSDIFATYSGCQ